MRWVADGKYSSTGRPLTMILPSPGSVQGRRRTRATACLRRPVDWTRGWGTGVSWNLRGAAGARPPPGGGGGGRGGGGGGGGGVQLSQRRFGRGGPGGGAPPPPARRPPPLRSGE